MAKNSEKQRINLLNSYLQKEFGEKTVKLALDGGFTCPNRDGNLGFGGCSFCSSQGSGDNASNIDDQIQLLSKKWPSVSSYIAYFQNYTGTYAHVDRLRDLYYSAISPSFIKGLAIATRPDCLPSEVLDLLSELKEKTYLWVELGLQTTNDETARMFNRAYDTDIYFDAVERLKKKNIRTVTHLMLGLPGEDFKDMEKSLSDVVSQNIWGLKLHLLNMIKGTKMYEVYGDYAFFSGPEDYAKTVCDLLELTPSNVVIHRLSADSPKEILASPKWAYRKRLVIDTIKKEMENRDAYQGDKL